MADIKIKKEKTEIQAKTSIIDNLIERYPGYRSELKSERHIFESFEKFPTRRELWQLTHLVECLLSQFSTSYMSFDHVLAVDECFDHIWKNRDSFGKGKGEGKEFLPWFVNCVANFGRDQIKDASVVVGFDSSDISEDGGSVKYGYHGARNAITEKAQFNLCAYQMDYLSEEGALEVERDYNRRKTAIRKSHSRQLHAEKLAFKKALSRTLAELRPQERLLYDLYNDYVPYQDMYAIIGAKSDNAASTRRDGLVKKIETKMIKYWQAPKGFHYDNPLEPLRRQLMEITFIKGWSKNVTKELRVKIK